MTTTWTAHSRTSGKAPLRTGPVVPTLRRGAGRRRTVPVDPILRPEGGRRPNIQKDSAWVTTVRVST